MAIFLFFKLNEPNSNEPNIEKSSHICILGGPGEKNLFLPVSAVIMLYNSLTEQLLYVSHWAKWSPCIISLNRHIKPIRIHTALIPIYSWFYVNQWPPPKRNSKRTTQSFTIWFYMEPSDLSLHNSPSRLHHGFLGNRVFGLWPLWSHSCPS